MNEILDHLNKNVFGTNTFTHKKKKNVPNFSQSHLVTLPTVRPGPALPDLPRQSVWIL